MIVSKTTSVPAVVTHEDESTRPMKRKSILFAPETKDFDGSLNKDEILYLDNCTLRFKTAKDLFDLQKCKDCIDVCDNLLLELKNKFHDLHEGKKYYFIHKLKNLFIRIENLRNFSNFEFEYTYCYNNYEIGKKFYIELNFKEAIQTFKNIIECLNKCSNNKYVLQNYDRLYPHISSLKANCYFCLGNVYRILNKIEKSNLNHKKAIELNISLEKLLPKK